MVDSEGLDLFARFHARAGCGEALYQVHHPVRDADEYCLHTQRFVADVARSPQ